MTSDYVPVDCDQHALLAKRRTAVTARDDGPNGEMRIVERVVAVTARSGAEYLILQDAVGNGHPVRLDRLRELRDRAGERFWQQKTDKVGE